MCVHVQWSFSGNVYMSPINNESLVYILNIVPGVYCVTIYNDTALSSTKKEDSLVLLVHAYRLCEMLYCKIHVHVCTQKYNHVRCTKLAYHCIVYRDMQCV